MEKITILVAHTANGPALLGVLLVVEEYIADLFVGLFNHHKLRRIVRWVVHLALGLDLL